MCNHPLNIDQFYLPIIHMTFNSHLQKRTDRLRLASRILQRHNPIQHHMLIRRIAVHRKICHPHTLETDRVRWRRLLGRRGVALARVSRAQLTRPWRRPAHLVEARLQERVVVDLLRVRVDVCQESLRVRRWVFRLEEGVERAHFGADRAVVLRRFRNPVDVPEKGQRS